MRWRITKFICGLISLSQVSGKAYAKTFTDDIIVKYRLQPQSSSHIYRSVLLPKRRKSEDEGGQVAISSCDPQPPPTPSRMASSSTMDPDGEERGDLITFYNQVFLPLTEKYAMKFNRSRQSPCQMPPLSPLPQLRANPASPCRRVSDKYSVYTRPLRPSHNAVSTLGTMPSPGRVETLSYTFSRSPSKVG